MTSMTYASPPEDAIAVPAEIELQIDQNNNQSIKQTDSQSEYDVNKQPIESATIQPLSDSKSGALPSLNDYLRYIELLYESWSDAPSINLSVNHLTYTVQTHPDEVRIPSVGQAVKDLFGKLSFQSPDPIPLDVLKDVTSTIKQQSMTLILAPPGAGKSSLLNVLAGRCNIKQSKTQSLTGDVWFNGLTKREHQSINQSIEKMCNLVGQSDIHMASLTVRETLQFALDSSVVDLSLLNQSVSQSINQTNSQSANQSTNQSTQAELNALHARKVDLILSVLGMHECAETIAGNDALRGISGGQKRRLSVAEFMITNARVLLLDEVTNGLDAAVARDLFVCLKKWCEISKGTVVSSLQQPTPEVYALFDSIILMREGSIMYQGPKEDVATFLLQYHGIEINSDQDVADFLVEWLADPSVVYSKQRRRWSKGLPATIAGFNVQLNKSEELTNQPNDQSINQSTGIVVPQTAKVCLTNQSMVEAYQSSPWFAAQLESIADIVKDREGSNNQSNGQSLLARSALTAQSASPYTKAQFMHRYSASLATLTKLVLKRQVTLTSRDYETIPARMFSAILVSVITGSLFLRLDQTDYYAKFGMLLSALLNLAMGNFSELGATFEGRNTVLKHLDSSFYPATAFIFSIVITWFPVMAVESILFSVPIYFMSGLAEDAGSFFFFVLVLFLSDLMYASLFRAVCYMVASIDRAEQVVNPVFDCLILFGGFMVTASKIPDFLIEFYWIDPVAWAMRSLAQNEFYSPSYGGNGERALVLFEIQTERSWKWAGVGFMIGFTAMCIALCCYFLAEFRFDLSQGTKRTKVDQSGPSVLPTQPRTHTNSPIEMTPQLPQQSSSRVRNTGLSLPFTPASLVFQDLHYTVQVKNSDGQTVDRKLLNGISGYVKPGQLTALIGASGAGKTTLMDVIAGRKTVGKIEGTVTVNGKPQDPDVYKRVSSYAEQQDLHAVLATVRESLLFSAFLRLPKSVEQHTREAFVDEIIDLLELTNVKNRIIGNDLYAGLSPGQLKLITIGVELCSNPSILFLDEPTSSLDSRAALVVMRVVKNIAATGRTVLCTIHQPSSEVFFLFDYLLMLKSGGQTVYFGPVGEQGQSIIEYFENDSRIGEEARNVEKRLDAPKIPHGMNPSSWALDVIGAGVEGALLRAQIKSGAADASSLIDYASLYQNSQLCKHEMTELSMVSIVDPSQQVHVNLSEYVKSSHQLLWALFKRSTLSAWRDSHSNFGRILGNLFLGVAFGLIFLQIDDSDYAGVNSKLNSIFYIAALSGWGQCILTIPILISARSSYYRERASDSYPSWCYSLCLSLVDMPYIAAATFALLVPSYFMIGFVYDGEYFFRFFLSIFVSTLVLCSFGQWTAATFASYVASTVVSSTMLLFFFLFGGSFIHPDQIPTGWLWFMYSSPIPRALFACSVDQFRCDAENPYSNTVECPSIYVDADDGTSTLATTHSYINSVLEVGYDTYGNHIAYMIAMWVVWQVATSVSLRYINHLKR